MRETARLISGTFVFFCLFWLTSSLPLDALEQRTIDAAVCDDAISTAAHEFGIPKDILKAIARTESGITVEGAFVAWPWTINVEGQGERFNSKAEALRALQINASQGKRNIDLGCFQINFHWHGRHFPSAEAMLDPSTNTRYAAQFLKDLYAEFGSWTAAAGAFHSRTAAHARTYLAKFIPILQQLNQSPSVSARLPDQSARPNAFPLLTGKSQSGARGSLFPVETKQKRSLLNRSEVRG